MQLKALFGSAAIILLCVPDAAQTAPGAGIDVLHYDVEVTPDLPGKSLRILLRLRFKVTQNGLAKLTFSRNEMVIEDARIDGLPAPTALTGDTLGFTLPKLMKAGAVATLTVRYHGQPKAGTVFSDDGASVYTDYFACSWLICAQDAPGDKATAAIDLILPKGQASLSVGNAAPPQNLPDGTVRHRWQMQRAYSPYLMAFAAGAFNEVRAGPRLTYLTTINDQDTVTKLFGTTEEMLRFFESKAGIRLPPKRYTQLLIDGSEAQEAATYATIGREELDPILKDPTDDWVIAHELAHQWWGNLVTCKSWKHFWLNEGITTFMTAAWKEHKHGRAAYNAELDHAREHFAQASQRGFDKVLTFDGPYPSLGTRRAIQYSKGALFMDHLRTILGEAAFWAGLKRFTQQHAGGVVESSDLKRAFEAASRRDLSAEFTRWVGD